jgi:hypothetical protein
MRIGGKKKEKEMGKREDREGKEKRKTLSERGR